MTHAFEAPSHLGESARTTASAMRSRTSVPWMPIATPMSALFSAGASFTPSPVIDTTKPWRCRDLHPLLSPDSQLSLGFLKEHLNRSFETAT